MYILLIIFSKEKVIHKFSLLNFVMETLAHTTLIPVQQIPPATVIQQAGVGQRGRVNVSAARVLG